MQADKRLNRSMLIFWYKRAHSKRPQDKIKVKELYSALAGLTEYERGFLYKKYFHKNGKYTDKEMAAQLGMTEKECRKVRLSIENKLYKLFREDNPPPV